MAVYESDFRNAYDPATGTIKTTPGAGGSGSQASTSATATSIAVSSVTLTGTYTTGSRLLPTKYVDSGVADAGAYTPVTAPWTTNGKNAANSYNPTDYMPAGVKAIPHQLWWSANDATVDTVTSPGTPGTNIQAYKNAYGANCTLQEISGDPAHGLAFSGWTAAKLQLLNNFLIANA